jgi:hypothetical protein
MGDGCGSGTGLDPDSIFYCASLGTTAVLSLTLVYIFFMFPALLHRADAGDEPPSVRIRCQRGQYRYFLIFFRTRKGLACTG